MIFTLLALFGAVVASYTDLKQGIIQNELTMGLFGIGIIGHLVLNGTSVLRDLLSSIGLIFAIGFGFWVLGGWSAGDAKEFLFLAALLPRYPAFLESYFQPVLGSYPFVLTIFINTFLAILPFILIWGIYSSLKQSGTTALFKPLREVEKVALNALVVSSSVLVTILLNLSGVFAIPLIFLAYRLKEKLKFLLSILVTAAYLIITLNFYFAIRNLALIFIFFMLFRFFWNSVQIIREQTLKYTVKIDDLKEGMVLSETLYNGNEKIETKAKGLDTKGLKKIQDMKVAGKINEVSVKKTTPFAPVILMGLIISLTLGDFIWVVRNG